jgi:WD40 repeat protein
VAPTVHSITILPAIVQRVEPMATNLVGSLAHPKHDANLLQLAFSPDGKKLFASGYTSGVVQIWDVASKKELRRIDTPAGDRSSAEYALLSNDWKKLYVWVNNRSVKRLEGGGNKRYRIDYAGNIRVWETESGKELAPIQPMSGSAPDFAKLSPDGRFLVSDDVGWDPLKSELKYTTVVRNLESGRQWRCGGTAIPSFAHDARTMMVRIDDDESNTSVIKVLDLPTGKELARLNGAEKDRSFSIAAISPDDSIMALMLGRKKGAPTEIWFRDGRTLEDRGKLIGAGDPERYGWTQGVFSLDSKQFITFDGTGQALVRDVAGRKIDRTVRFGADRVPRHVILSPDGHTVAVAWAPKAEAEDLEDEPDPQDLPQPRVSLIDINGRMPTRLLIAPHGYVGALAFSPDGKTLAFGSSGAVHLFDLTR